MLLFIKRIFIDQTTISLFNFVLNSCLPATEILTEQFLLLHFFEKLKVSTQASKVFN